MLLSLLWWWMEGKKKNRRHWNNIFHVKAEQGYHLDMMHVLQLSFILVYSRPVLKQFTPDSGRYASICVFKSFHTIFAFCKKRLKGTRNTHVKCNTLCQRYLWLDPVTPLLLAHLLYCLLECQELFNGWKMCKTTDKTQQLVTETINVIETGSKTILLD